LIATLRPALVVVNPACDGRLDLRVVQALRLAVPRGRIVVRSRLVDHTAVATLIQLGVRGSLVPGAEPGRRVCDALALIAETGCCILAPSVAEAIRHAAIGSILLPREAPPLPALSERKETMLRLIAGGAGYEEIATRLALRPRTVRRTAEPPGTGLGSW